MRCEAFGEDIATNGENLMPFKSGTVGFKTALGLLVSIMSFASVVPVLGADSAAKPAPLTGGFYQLNDYGMPWYWTRKPAPHDDELVRRIIDYGQLLGKFRDELGLNTVVIQYLRYRYSDPNQNPSEFIPKAWEVKYGDPLIETLKEANKNNHAVKVYLGLEYNDKLFNDLGGNSSVKQALEQQAANDGALAQTVADYVKSKGADFDGWYITTELGNWSWSSDPQRKAQFAKYVADVAAACLKAKPTNDKGEPMKVAISPYFNPVEENSGASVSNLSAERFAQHVSDIVTGSSVTNIMMQDGIGAQATNTESFVTDYFTEMQKKLPANMTLAADVELFAGNQTAPEDRVLNQLKVQSKLHLNDVLGFDILQYASPVPTDDAVQRDGIQVLFGSSTARLHLYDTLKKLKQAANLSRLR